MLSPRLGAANAIWSTETARVHHATSSSCYSAARGRGVRTESALAPSSCGAALGIGWMDAAKPRKAEERMIARRLILGAAIAAGVLGVAPKVAAQGYPEKPIKLIVPFPAGGPIDTMARFMTQALGTRLRQSIVIENRPGGGATI